MISYNIRNTFADNRRKKKASYRPIFNQQKSYAEIAQIENYHNKCISYKLLSVNDYEQMALTKEIGSGIG